LSDDLTLASLFNVVAEQGISFREADWRPALSLAHKVCTETAQLVLVHCIVGVPQASTSQFRQWLIE
jgi:hypothetical protein